jgi:hypothetical protein
MPQDFESPEPLAVEVDADAASRSVMADYAMRPLTTGEVLDRTFSIYRSRFWLFAGISAVSGAVQLVANGISLTGQQFVMTRYGFATATMESITGSAIGAVLFLMAAAITQAATVYALSEVYTGRTVTVVASLTCAAALWYRYIGIAAWQLWSALWLTLVLVTPGVVLLVPRLGFRSIAWLGALLVFVAVICGTVYGAIAYLRNSLAIPASVVEHSRMRPSMRRSKTLSVGGKGRIFVVLLIAAVLFWVGGAIQAPMAFFIVRAPMQSHTVARAALLLLNFVTHTLVSPVALIGLSLVYFDQRVRLEGLDLLMMLGGDVATAGAALSTSVRGNGPDAIS